MAGNAGPGAVCRNAASTDSQNRCGSRSSRPAGTRATRSDSPAAPAWPIQDRSSTVFPLPGPGHVITDMGSLDMTKHSRDLVKRGAAPSTSGSGQVTGPAGGDPRAQRRRGSGLCQAHLACRIGGRALAAKRNAWPAVVFIPVAYADYVGGSCQLSGRVRAAMSRSGSRPGTGLLDRHGERAVLDGVLDQARGGSSAVLVVRGEPGIGKTALLDYAAGRAVGFRVVRAWGVESEMELAFAGLHQLCVPMLGRLEQLPGPQRDALAVAFGMREGPAPDRFLVGLAVLSLLAATAEDQPLACLVDDAQWLDRASVQCLAFAARRLLAEPVAVILAARQPDDHDELAGLPGLTVTGLPGALGMRAHVLFFAGELAAGAAR